MTNKAPAACCHFNTKNALLRRDRAMDKLKMHSPNLTEDNIARIRDAGFKDSAVKINVEQIFKLLSPSTEVKSI